MQSSTYHKPRVEDQDFWTKPEEQPAEEKPETPKPAKGRHVFTKEECQLGFERAIESIITRHPDAIMKDGRHMACNFLKSKQRAA